MFNLTDYDWIVSYLVTISIGAIFIMLLIRRTYTYFERNNIFCVQPPSFPTGNMGNVHRAKLPIYVQLWRFYQKVKRRELKLGGFYCYLHPCIIVADKEIAKTVVNPSSEDFGVLKYNPISEPGTYYNFSECNEDMLEVILDVLLRCLDCLVPTKGDNVISTRREIYKFVNNITCTSVQHLFKLRDKVERPLYRDLSCDCYCSNSKLKLLTSIYPKIDVRNAGKYTELHWRENVSTLLKFKELREKCAPLKRIEDVMKHVSPLENRLAYAFIMLKLGNEEIADIYCKAVQSIRFTEHIVTFALKEMYAQPAIEKKLREEIEGLAIQKHNLSERDLDGMKYLEAFACETLRKYPINPYYVRRALRDVEIDNVVFKKNQLVFVPTMAIQRDHDNYPNPHHFNPDRFLQGNPIDPLKFFPCTTSREFRIVKALLKGYVYVIIRSNTIFENYRDDININMYNIYYYFLSSINYSHLER